MNKYSDYDLEPIWQAILDVYQEVERVCTAHQLRFYAGFGTALGALRHQGFIPWDDDFDLVMPLSDYRRFLEIAEVELPSHLCLITPANTPEIATHSYSKVLDVRFERTDELSRRTGHPLPDGINIDIFPLSGAPRVSFAERFRRVLLRMRRNYIMKAACPTLKSRIARILGAMLTPVFPHYRTPADVWALDEQMLSQYPFDESEYVGHYIPPHFVVAESCPRSVFDKARRVPFQGRSVLVPVGVEEMLASCYGDFMELPPEEKRCLGHAQRTPHPWKYGPTGSKVTR